MTSRLRLGNKDLDGGHCCGDPASTKAVTLGGDLIGVRGGDLALAERMTKGRIRFATRIRPFVLTGQSLLQIRKYAAWSVVRSVS
jgi:hypothetical protein